MNLKPEKGVTKKVLELQVSHPKHVLEIDVGSFSIAKDALTWVISLAPHFKDDFLTMKATDSYSS